MESKKQMAIFQAVLAAACYGVSAPLSKMLLEQIPPMLMAALLYLGAGLGMAVIHLLRRARRSEQKEARMTRQELPYIAGMIALDIAAPIFLMMGLRMATSSSASLLGNFEIVATSLIALSIFKEAIGKRMWISIGLIVLSSFTLSIEDFGSFSLSMGSLFVLLACVCWGFENNCTRMLSLKDPLQIVIVKGFGSGLGSLILAAGLRESAGNMVYLGLALLLGFFAYGLSIYFYVLAQRELGAARTSAYYAVAPFIGVGLSFVLFRQTVTLSFGIAFVIMMLGAYFAAAEKHQHRHRHEPLVHEHRHSHTDRHHTHAHDMPPDTEHSHLHTHEELSHTHRHIPDLHHIHSH